MTCFRGTQTCEGGRFGPCADGTITVEAARPLRPQNARDLFAISTAEACDDPSSPFFNACDPGCMYFDEDPTDIVADPYVEPPLPTYSGNPVGTICNVDPCVASTMPMDYACSDCVADVCDADMTCCTDAWTQACVNSALDICYGIDVPDVPGLCGFGLFSDSTLTTANRPATNAMIGSYGDMTIGTDADLVNGGILTKGNLQFMSLNGNDIDAAQGIYADGNITSQNSNTRLSGDMFAGGYMDLPAWTLAGGYEVSAVGNISGANGTESFGDLNSQGSFSGVAASGTSCSGMASCYTHTPVELPPQTTYPTLPPTTTAIPVLMTDCSGADGNVSGNGGTTTVSGPGSYGDLTISNDGNLILNGEGTYYFNSFNVNGGSIILEPDMGGSVGWDIRVCGTVNFDNDTRIVGGTGLSNDTVGTLIDPTLLTFYADTSGTITFGVETYFTGIFMAPKGTVTKSNMNNPPHRLDVLLGNRAAPVHGAIWANTMSLGTSAIAFQIPESDCEDMNIPGTVDTPGVYMGSCPISNVLPASGAALNSPCATGSDCQMNHRCVEPETDGACGHSKCATGAALVSTCDPCVEQICAVDSNCCSGTWDASCVAKVDTVCDAVCGSTAPEGGTCTNNSDGFTESCGGYDLSLGVPCSDELEICNHGDGAFFGQVTVGYWPDSDNQMGGATPLMSPEGTCTANNLSIAAGRCATVTCAVPVGTYTLMVDPEDALGECDDRRSDNWTVDDDRTCVVDGSTVTTLEVEDYTDYSNTFAGGVDAGRGGDLGFETCTDTSGCGYNAGYLSGGDFIEWTYDAPLDGMYEVDVRLASTSGWSQELYLDGALAVSHSGASTGGLQAWTTRQLSPFYMTAGTHTLRLTFTSGFESQNVNYIEVVSPAITDDSIVQIEKYEATCTEPGTIGLWGLLGWDADTPDASTVTFEALIADSDSDLDAAIANPLSTWTTIGVAQSQVLPNTESCGLSSSCVTDITGALGLNQNQSQHMALRITVDPDIATTTLYDWVVTYSCVYDQ